MSFTATWKLPEIKKKNFFHKTAWWFFAIVCCTFIWVTFTLQAVILLHEHWDYNVRFLHNIKRKLKLKFIIA